MEIVYFYFFYKKKKKHMGAATVRDALIESQQSRKQERKMAQASINPPFPLKRDQEP